MVSKGMEFVIKILKERAAQDIKERVEKQRSGMEDLKYLDDSYFQYFLIKLDSNGN